MKLSVFYDHIREAADQTGLPLAHICRLAREAGISGVEVNLTDVEEILAREIPYFSLLIVTRRS